MIELGAPGPDLAYSLSSVGVLAVTAFEKFFSRFHWVSLLSALTLAAICWRLQRRADPTLAGVGLLGFLFPRSVWLHRSALLDYRFVLFDKAMLALLSGAVGFVFVSHAIETDPDDFTRAEAASLAVVAAYTVTLLLVSDLFRYWAHRIMHDSPLLWQFHKVHHSPEVLVPFSQMRSHPVNGLVNALRSVLALGLVTGLFLLVTPGKLTPLSILGVNAGRFLFDFMGANLRHSHVWLSFGPRWSHIFISPAQHQIHHSRDPRHHNRNYGSQFAIWDWMFGTLYVPREREKLAFGIDADSTQRMRTIRGLYLEPFKDAAAVVKRAQARRRGRAA